MYSKKRNINIKKISNPNTLTSKGVSGGYISNDDKFIGEQLKDNQLSIYKDNEYYLICNEDQDDKDHSFLNLTDIYSLSKSEQDFPEFYDYEYCKIEYFILYVLKILDQKQKNKYDMFRDGNVMFNYWKNRNDDEVLDEHSYTHSCGKVLEIILSFDAEYQILELHYDSKNNEYYFRFIIRQCTNIIFHFKSKLYLHILHDSLKNLVPDSEREYFNIVFKGIISNIGKFNYELPHDKSPFPWNKDEPNKEHYESSTLALVYGLYICDKNEFCCISSSQNNSDDEYDEKCGIHTEFKYFGNGIKIYFESGSHLKVNYTEFNYKIRGLTCNRFHYLLENRTKK